MPITSSAGWHHLSHPRYRPDIDGLRAIAVLSVVCFHVFPELIKGGFVGVDIFFVISGYLISGIIFDNLERGSFSYVEFYARRIRRIFPALILVLCASFVYGWFVLLAREYKQLGEHIAAGAGFVSNFALWNEAGYFDADAKTKPLLHLWSLGIEEQFYIVWPLLLGYVWKRKHNLLAITLLVAAASFVVNIYSVQDHIIAAFYSPIARFWELMAGGVLAYVVSHSNRRLPVNPEWRSVAGLLLIILAIVLTNKNKAFPGWWALLPVVGTVFVISAGADSRLNRNVLGNPILVWFGLISYPLYLWHWPILSFARISEGETLTDGIRIAIVLASITLAWLTYRFVEKPARFGGWGRIKIILLCGLMITIGFAGYNAYSRDGLPFRKYQREFFFYDWKAGYRYEQCFINGTDKPSSFASYCQGPPFSKQAKPLVLLWGDSHAASLYRGLYNRSNTDNFALAQFNASGCPPVMNFSVAAGSRCQKINDYVFQKIRELRPNTVVLAANWMIYNGEDTWNELDFTKLKDTIQMLRGLNIRNIIIFGQLPAFDAHQPDIGQVVFRANKIDRTFERFDRESVVADEKIKVFAQENKVSYVSPQDLLCNTEGCLISTSREKFYPLAWDYSHLTEAGSTLLVDRAVRSHELVLPSSTLSK